MKQSKSFGGFLFSSDVGVDEECNCILCVCCVFQTRKLLPLKPSIDFFMITMEKVKSHHLETSKD